MGPVCYPVTPEMVKLVEFNESETLSFCFSSEKARITLTDGRKATVWLQPPAIAALVKEIPFHKIVSAQLAPWVLAEMEQFGTQMLINPTAESVLSSIFNCYAGLDGSAGLYDEET